MEDGLITVPEAARRYGLSARTIGRLHERGLLTIEKRVGQRAALVRPDDVERALQRRAGAGRPRRGQKDGSPPHSSAHPLLVRLDEVRKQIMGNRVYDGCSAELLREAREERFPDL